MAAPVTLTFEEAQAWLKARTYHLHLGLTLTEQLLSDERQAADHLRADRDRLAAEVAILKAERGARPRPHHVQPHER